MRCKRCWNWKIMVMVVINVSICSWHSLRLPLDAASRIYSAYITHGVVESGKERKYMRAAVKEALAMAANIDEVLKADGEL